MNQEKMAKKRKAEEDRRSRSRSRRRSLAKRILVPQCFFCCLTELYSTGSCRICLLDVMSCGHLARFHEGLPINQVSTMSDYIFLDRLGHVIFV